jgi:hypothetical protein
MRSAYRLRGYGTAPLRHCGGTLAELGKATGIPAAELDAILESMANKGLVMELAYAGATYYLLMPGNLDLRARRHLPGEAPPLSPAAAQPGRPLRPNPVGEGAARSLRRRGSAAPLGR